MMFFTAAGWFLLLLSIIMIVTGASETAICSCFIMSQLAFIQGNIEVIQEQLK